MYNIFSHNFLQQYMDDVFTIYQLALFQVQHSYMCVLVLYLTTSLILNYHDRALFSDLYYVLGEYKNFNVLIILLFYKLISRHKKTLNEYKNIHNITMI